MKRSRFNEEEVIGILREGESGSSVKAVCAQHNISEATYLRLEAQIWGHGCERSAAAAWA